MLESPTEIIFSSYLQGTHGESIHVVPEDQGTLWPSGGDGRCLKVSGLTVASVRTVCTHVPTLRAVAISGTAENIKLCSNSAADFIVS